MSLNGNFSVDNFHLGRIIGLNDFVKNLDKTETILNEKIFIIVYFFYLKYFEQSMLFNEHDLYFKEDYEYEWGFRLELSESKKDTKYFYPTTFAFIYNNTKGLKHEFLHEINTAIYKFSSSQTNDKKFMINKTIEILKRYEHLEKIFNSIFGLNNEQF